MNKSTIEKKVKSYNKKGNPFKRGNTWTYICYPIDPVSGTKKPKWCGGYKTEKEAKEALRQSEAEIQMGIYVPSSKVSVEQCINHWFERAKLILEPNSINGYQSNIKKHIVPLLGKYEIGKLTKNDIANFIESLKSKGLAPRTITYIRDVLKMALDDAVDDGILKKNVCIGVPLPKQKKYHATVLNVEQSRLLIQGAIGSSIELEVLLALTLGLRRGEVLGLKFSDFNFEEKTVHIKRQVTCIKIHEDESIKKLNQTEELFGIKDLKTEGSDRILCVPMSILDSVKKRHQVNSLKKIKMGLDYQDQDLLSCRNNGECLSPQTLYHRFKCLIKKLQLPDIRFHDLRHSCATLLLNYDIPLKEISQLLGHSTIGITADIYCDIFLKKKQETAEMMENTVFGDKKSC